MKMIDVHADDYGLTLNTSKDITKEFEVKAEV